MHTYGFSRVAYPCRYHSGFYQSPSLAPPCTRQGVDIDLKRKKIPFKMDYIRPLSRTMADQPTIRLATPEGK